MTKTHSIKWWELNHAYALLCSAWRYLRTTPGNELAMLEIMNAAMHVREEMQFVDTL